MHSKEYTKQLKAILESFRKERESLCLKLLHNSVKRPIVVTNSIYVPEELVIALGANLILVDEMAFIQPEKITAFIYSDSPEIDKRTKKLKELLDDNHSYAFERPKENSLLNYQNSLITLMQFLEKSLKKKYTESKLNKAIKTCNETRYTLSQVSEVRRIYNTAISLKDWQEILHMSWLLPRSNFNKIMKKLLKAIKYLPGTENDLPGFILCGEAQESDELKVLIEESGGKISCDLESRNYPRFSKVITEKRPYLEALAEAYFYQFPSVTFTKASKRIEKLKNIVDMFDAKGLIYQVKDKRHLYDKEIELAKKQGIATLKVDMTHFGENSCSQLKSFVDKCQKIS